MSIIELLRSLSPFVVVQFLLHYLLLVVVLLSLRLFPKVVRKGIRPR